MTSCFHFFVWLYHETDDMYCMVLQVYLFCETAW